MTLVCKYVALFVPDLRAAEELYDRVFGMELLFRESQRSGQWRTLPAGTGWDEAKAAGVGIEMVALRRDDFVLALFEGTPRGGTVLEVCLGLPADEIARVSERLPAGATILERRDGYLRFDDPFGFRWAVQEQAARFRSSGEIAGRWVEL